MKVKYTEHSTCLKKTQFVRIWPVPLIWPTWCETLVQELYDEARLPCTFHQVCFPRMCDTEWGYLGQHLQVYGCCLFGNQGVTRRQYAQISFILVTQHSGICHNS